MDVDESSSKDEAQKPTRQTSTGAKSNKVSFNSFFFFIIPLFYIKFSLINPLPGKVLAAAMRRNEHNQRRDELHTRRLPKPSHIQALQPALASTPSREESEISHVQNGERDRREMARVHRAQGAVFAAAVRRRRRRREQQRQGQKRSRRRLRLFLGVLLVQIGHRNKQKRADKLSQSRASARSRGRERAAAASVAQTRLRLQRGRVQPRQLDSSQRSGHRSRRRRARRGGHHAAQLAQQEGQLFVQVQAQQRQLERRLGQLALLVLEQYKGDDELQEAAGCCSAHQSPQKAKEARRHGRGHHQLQRLGR